MLLLALIMIVCVIVIVESELDLTARTSTMQATYKKNELQRLKAGVMTYSYMRGLQNPNNSCRQQPLAHSY